MPLELNDFQPLTLTSPVRSRTATHSTGPVHFSLSTIHRLTHVSEGERSTIGDRSSDAQILKQAKEALCSSGYDQLRKLNVHCHHGRIILQGRVATYYLKQVAQESLRGIAGLRDIDNDLHVVCCR